jgi:hypothetical protein
MARIKSYNHRLHSLLRASVGFLRRKTPMTMCTKEARMLLYVTRSRRLFPRFIPGFLVSP